jgi:orotidine-5'-phosphate decarboxylase
VNPTEPKVIVALDFFSQSETLDFLDKIDVSQCRLKVGKQLFTATGPELVRKLVARGYDVFLDLKFHDIPNTVGRACKAAADLGVWMVDVHAMGGGRMMDAARAGLGDSASRLIAVTLLTSSDRFEMEQIGLVGTPDTLVMRLADLANRHGLDGVVCSASEATALRREYPDDFCLVTPGIRLSATASNDQKRTVTPGQAIDNGADYLVIGRPITQAKDPAGVLESINRSLVHNRCGSLIDE